MHGFFAALEDQVYYPLRAVFEGKPVLPGKKLDRPGKKQRGVSFQSLLYLFLRVHIQLKRVTRDVGQRRSGARLQQLNSQRPCIPAASLQVAVEWNSGIVSCCQGLSFQQKLSVEELYVDLRHRDGD